MLWYRSSSTSVLIKYVPIKRKLISLFLEMKVPTALFKTTISLLVLVLLFLLSTFYEELQRNRDLYTQVMALHENVNHVTVERQVCSNKIGREEMIIVDRVSNKGLNLNSVNKDDLQRSQLKGVSQWLANVKKALSEVTLERSDLRQFITNTTFYISQEKKVWLKLQYLLSCKLLLTF